MEDLVKRAKEGDNEAFSEMILLIKQELYYLSKTKLNNEEDIADCIQDTILIGYQNLKKLKENCYFKTWIIKILINQCNKRIRKKKRQETYIENEQLENCISKDELETENIGFDILIKDLLPDEKMILTLFYRFEYTVKEISIMLNKNENTIKSKIQRARKKLKNKYEGEENDRY